MSTDTSTPALEALQLALAAEHAAVFVYGALGAQTSASSAPTLHRRLVAAYRVHQQRREDLTARLVALDATPQAAQPGYTLPADLGSAAAVTRRARSLEAAASAAYVHLVANTAGRDRRWGVDALLDSAVRALDFGSRPEAYPGL